MALYLIGLGLYDEKDISVKGLEIAKNCDILYMEEYTSKLGVEKKKIEELIGKKIKILSRKEVEQSDILLKDAKEKEVGFLVGGDPLTATTHSEFLIEAKKKGIETKVIHSSSIYTSVCESGLFIYKFGKSCSIPFPTKSYNPKSFFETIQTNQKNNLHTLVFLDLKPEENRFMTINEAIKILIEAGMNENQLIVGLARIGSDNQTIKSGKANKLIDFDFKKPQHILIVPGELHFMEEEALRQVS